MIASSPRQPVPEESTAFAPDWLHQIAGKGALLKNILFLIAAILIAVWLVGLIFNIVGGIIHILLVVAVAIFIFGFIKRKVSR